MSSESIISIKTNIETPKNEPISSFVGTENFKNNTKSEDINITYMDFDTEVSEGENINIENEEELTTTNEELETQVTESIPQYKTYTVSKYGSGEGFSTLWAISQDSGVSIEDIKAANPEIGADNVIHPEQIIIVPINSTITPEEVVPPVTNENKVQEEVIEDFIIEEIEEPIVTENKEEVINDNIEQSNINNDESISSVTVPNNLVQTGICKDFTGYNLQNWNRNTTQRELYDYWNANGCNSDRGIATIDNHYLVAVSPVFGKVGDKIRVELEDGMKIDCIIGDQKGSDARSEYGHIMQYKGNDQVSIIEWEACNGNNNTEIKSNIELGDWRNKSVKAIYNYGSYMDNIKS